MMKSLWKIIRAHIFLHLWLCVSKVDADPRWLEGEVRLVGGKDVNEGTVLIHHNGTWGIVCHDNWDLRDANVVCRQMGYPGASKAVKNSQFGRGRRQVWMSGVHCRGNEPTLSRCYFRGWGRYQPNDCDGRWVSAGAICNKRDSTTTTSSSTSTTTTTTTTPKPTTTTTTTTTPRPTTTTTTTTRKPTTTTTTRKPTTTTTTHKPTTTTTTPKPTTTTTSARQTIPQSGRRRPIATDAPRERPLTFLNIISSNPEQINSRRRGPVIIPASGDEDSGSNGGEGSENKEEHGENEAAGVTRGDTFIQSEEMRNEVNANVEEKPITVQTVESEDEEIKNEINEKPTGNTTEQRQFDVWIYDNSSHRYIMYRSNGDIVTSPPDPKLFTVRSGWNEADANRDTKNNENGNSNGEENGHSGGDDAPQNSSSSSYSDSSSDSDSEATETHSASLGNNGGDKGDEDSANVQQANARAPEDDSGGNERHEDEQSTGTITVQEAQRTIIQQQHSINQMRNEIQREGDNITRLQGEIDRASERIVNNTEARTELREEQRVVEYMREEINHENEQINQLQQEVDGEREVIQDARPVVEDQRIRQVSTNLNHGKESLNEVIQNVEVQRQDVSLRVSDVRNGSIRTNQRDRNTNHIDDKYNDIYLADDPRKLKPVAEKLISNPPTTPPPPTYTEFRLEGGRIHGEGRIDIRLAGSNKWGTICGDSWGIREAIVACRHFGVGYARIAVTRSYYGGANMDKVLAGLKCTGKEQRLDECNFVMTNGEPGQVACDRADSVAGISCTNYLADLIPNVTRLEHSAFLQDRYLYYLQCAMEENCLAESARDIYKQPRWTSHTRRLFRFSTIAHNHGNADFRPELERHNWQWHACHQHYHSMDVFAHYDITDRHGNRVAEGMKASFCLEDSECQHGVKPKYDCNYYGDQGLTVGCSDNYLADIDCQWIDVTDLKPGFYKFQMAINPRLRVPEMSFENNVVSCDLYYNGYHAQLSKCELTGLL